MYKTLIFSLLLVATSSFSQKGVTTFGLQYKPIIPNRIIGTYEVEFNKNQLESSLKQKWGHSFGMVVRQGLTKNISLETGINFTQRNFDLFWEVPDSGFAETNDLSVISYEIPLCGLVYIRIGENLYMNTSLGAAMTLFASDVSVQSTIRGSEAFVQEGAYKHKLQGALLSNIGFEYRTRNSGYFYFGTSYHLPFTDIMTIAMSYEYKGGQVVAIDNILGSYITVDFRYFFNERPDAEDK